MTKIHTIRFYDRDLLKAARIQAVTDGITLRQLVEDAIRDYLEHCASFAQAQANTGPASEAVLMPFPPYDGASEQPAHLEPEPRAARRP